VEKVNAIEDFLSASIAENER